jgi:CBS domain-containing protein
MTHWLSANTDTNFDLYHFCGQGEEYPENAADCAVQQVLEMNVSEIMANAVHTVDKGDHLEKAAKIMAEHDIGCVLVESGDSIAGIVTDRDLVCRGLVHADKLDEITVADVMTPEPVYCCNNDTVNQAAAIMEEHQVRRLPVFDMQHHLMGIVSMGDVCTHVRHELAGELIETVSKPAIGFLAEAS